MNAPSELPRLERVETDLEKARKYKERLKPLLRQVCDVLSEAKRDNIIINYQTTQDATGNHFISLLTALKELKE